MLRHHVAIVLAWAAVALLVVMPSNRAPTAVMLLVGQAVTVAMFVAAWWIGGKPVWGLWFTNAMVAMLLRRVLGVALLFDLVPSEYVQTARVADQLFLPWGITLSWLIGVSTYLVVIRHSQNRRQKVMSRIARK